MTGRGDDDDDGGGCNVMAANRGSLLLNFDLGNGVSNRGGPVLGGALMTKEPYAAVTRPDDAEFSDVVNWAIQALFFGEERGLVKDVSLCNANVNVTGKAASDLDFLNAVYCVGNYGEIFDGDENNRGPNQINDGTTGMLYTIPFGQLERAMDREVSLDGTVLHGIRNDGTLNCGVIIPGEQVREADGVNITDMNTRYCHTVAAALFNGNFASANLVEFSENDDDAPFLALSNGTIDVLAGAKISRRYDFASPPLRQGSHFSIPYYYGRETNG